MNNTNISTFYIKEYFENIKSMLRQLGYENKSINTDTAIELYKEYGENISEEVFIKEVLDVSIENYKRSKKYKTNIVILKVKDTLKEEQMTALREKLILLGYAMKKVNYKQFLNLYKEFGKGLKERTFAIKILNMKYRNYETLKLNPERKFVILKNCGNIDEVINEMIDDGYGNSFIKNYKDFLILYSEYGYLFSELTFAENILKISYDYYRRLKKKEEILLRILPVNISDEIERKIIVLKEKGYSKRLIDYTEFLQLYEEYGTIFTEEEFAKDVLLLTIDSYKSIKFQKKRAVILKEKEQVHDYEVIIDELVENGYCNKAIDYEKLKELYLKYGNKMEEKEFALNVLELSLDSYRALRRCNNTDKFRILKNEIPRETERIMNLLVSKGYTNKSCSLSEFQSLYLQYGTFISERQFAMQVLLVTSSAYQNFRYKGNIKMTILPFRELSEDEIKEIRNKLIKLGYEDKNLTKDEIDKLYSRYSGIMSKATFKEKVLELYNNYASKSSTVLKKTDNLDDEEIEIIKKTIYSKGLYYKRIKYDKIAGLYNEYGAGLTYNTFVNYVLGISTQQIRDAMSNNGYVRIIDINIKNTMDIITNKFLRETRYYSKEKLFNICNDYNVKLEQFILYSLVKNVKNKHDMYIETYMEILDKYDKLWIGNTTVSNEIIEKYYYEIEKVILRVISNVKSLYPMAYKYSQQQNDDFQDALLFFVENGSEIEKNFMVYDNELWQRYLYGKLKNRIKNCALDRIAILNNDDNFFLKQEEDERDKEFIDYKTNTENDALSNIEKEDYIKIKKCVLEFGNLLTMKISIDEAKENICNRFGITEYEFLEYMRIYADYNGLNNLDLTILGIGKIEEENNNKIKLKRYKN